MPVDNDNVELQAQSPLRTLKQSKSSNDAIYNWLSDIGLTEYHGILKTGGYENMSDLETITASDLSLMGITNQWHVKKILNSCPPPGCGAAGLIEELDALPSYNQATN